MYKSCHTLNFNTFTPLHVLITLATGLQIQIIQWWSAEMQKKTQNTDTHNLKKY